MTPCLGRLNALTTRAAPLLLLSVEKSVLVVHSAKRCRLLAAVCAEASSERRQRWSRRDPSDTARMLRPTTTPLGCCDPLLHNERRLQSSSLARECITSQPFRRTWRSKAEDMRKTPRPFANCHLQTRQCFFSNAFPLSFRRKQRVQGNRSSNHVRAQIDMDGCTGKQGDVGSVFGCQQQFQLRAPEHHPCEARERRGERKGKRSATQGEDNVRPTSPAKPNTAHLQHRREGQ
jgi:hypothetical protein